MSLIRPRLTDYHGIHSSQAELTFPIPFFDEDIPLYVDPFLIWKSPSLQDKSLHDAILKSFNNLGVLARSGKRDEALNQLVIASECEEVGLGVSASKKGKRIGITQAEQIIQLFEDLPQYRDGFRHFEEIQLYVDGIAKDRVSDFACSFLKDFLIDFTIDRCREMGIPMSRCRIRHLYSFEKQRFVQEAEFGLPINPKSNAPILFVPKRWLRFNPWISYESYFKDHCPQDDIAHEGEELTRVSVLNFNRQNYDVIEAYIIDRERTFEDCKSDPLFSQIPVISAKRKLAEIKKLPTGKVDNADRKYEDAVVQLLASMLYPHLDYATDQSRTDSGVLIRDMVFYNNRQQPFLKELFDDYNAKQLVFELKNVKAIEREHIAQLNRYISEALGKFGVLVTRHELSTAMRRNTIDLWSGQRRAIISLTDQDLEQMVEVFESKQRSPLDVLKKKYIEFRRSCPG